MFVCVVSHSQEQHHQTAGRKPAAEEWKHPNCAEDTTTFRGTQSHMHSHKSHHCLKTDENFEMVHPAFNISTIIPRTYYKLMHDTADIDVFYLGNPGRCVSGERHVQTVSSGFGWDVQRCSKATEGGVSAQTGQTAPDCVHFFDWVEKIDLTAYVLFLGCGEWAGRPDVHETGNGARYETSGERYSWKAGQHLSTTYSVFLFEYIYRA